MRRSHTPASQAAGKPIHTATANRVVRLLKQGELSLRAIAEQTGLSRYQVTKIRDDLSGRK